MLIRSIQIKVHFAGVCKSGTTTLFDAFAREHQQILVRKKEMHWWDNKMSNPNYTMAQFTSSYATATQQIVRSALNSKRQQDQFVIAEGTPRTFWDGDKWSFDPTNDGLDLPTVLSPQKLRHVTPDVKFIVILRDPVRRLLSDYKFFNHGMKSSEDFHGKVVRAVRWWRDCVAMHSEKRCVYGLTPPGLPTLDADVCISKHGEMTLRCIKSREWKNNTAARLRIGLYDLFIQDWFSVFKRNQFLFLKHEDFIQNGVDIIQTRLYPFLNIPKLDADRVERVKRILSQKQRPGKGTTVILPKTNKILREFYAPFNKRLSKTLNDKMWLFQRSS